jgi:signal transduction histidine kinase
MPSSRKANITLALALLLLCLGGIATGWVIFRLYAAQALVRHTLEVKVAIGDLESKLTEVGRSRVAYNSMGAPESLSAFSNAVSEVGPALARIRELTRDNRSQQALCERLEANANQRIAASRQSIELKSQNQSFLQTALQADFDVARTSSDTAAITEEMKQNEETLLDERTRISNLLFRFVLSILAVSFVLSAFMFWIHYDLLNREVQERREAEKQLRELSLELMQVQDEEHRRFARELHDGVGQTLAAFQASGKSTGVGLLSMKERVREQSGELEIGSYATGTEIVVKIPYSPRMASNSVAAESVS